MNVSETLEKLTRLMDDMDALYARSIGDIEEKLEAARGAVSVAMLPRESAPEKQGQSLEENASLQVEIGQLKATIAELEGGVEDGERGRGVLEESIRGLQSQLGERDTLLQSVQNELLLAREKVAKMDELERAAAECELLRGDLQAKNEELERLSAALEELQVRAGQATELEQSLQERDGSLRELEEKLAALEQGAREKETALETSCAELKTSLEGVTGELEVLRTEYQAQGEALNAHKTERESFTNELDILRMDHQAMLTELEEHKALAEKAREQLAALESEKAQVAKQLEEIQNAKGDREKLEQLLQQREEKVGELEQALTKTNEEREKAELQAKMLMGQMDSLQYQQREMETLKEHVARLEGELERERATVLRLKAQGPAPAAPIVKKGEGRDSDYMVSPPALNEEPAPAPAKKLTVNFERSRRGQRKRIGEILMEAEVITQEQLDTALKLKTKDPRRRVGSILVELGHVTEAIVAAALAAQLRMRYIEDLNQELDPGVIQFVPPHIARNHRCVPLMLNAGTLVVAMANPLDLIAIEDIEIASNMRVEPVVSSSSDIDTAITRYYLRNGAMANH
ncbi:MAG: hypothetical protein GXY07_17430 [Candidatus Hydrogenedentes bacterium]|nr:hypothetical protein [Candidatus Hydrogenedentota bacterium]